MAEKIVEINESVATMSNEEGATAIHLLVRQDKFYVFSRWQVLSNMLVFHSDAYWSGKLRSYPTRIKTEVIVVDLKLMCMDYIVLYFAISGRMERACSTIRLFCFFSR